MVLRRECPLETCDWVCVGTKGPIRHHLATATCAPLCHPDAATCMPLLPGRLPTHPSAPRPLFCPPLLVPHCHQSSRTSLPPLLAHVTATTPRVPPCCQAAATRLPLPPSLRYSGTSATQAPLSLPAATTCAPLCRPAPGPPISLPHDRCYLHTSLWPRHHYSRTCASRPPLLACLSGTLYATRPPLLRTPCFPAAATCAPLPPGRHSVWLPTTQLPFRAPFSPRCSYSGSSLLLAAATRTPLCRPVV